MKPYFMMCVFVLSHKVKYIIKSSKLKLEYHYKVFGHWGRLRNVGKGVSLWLLQTHCLGAGELSDEWSLPGTLWNLSSHDSIKMEIVDHALHALTDEVVIPHSGWEREPGEDCKPRHIEWESVLTNTAGCLRYQGGWEREDWALKDCLRLLSQHVSAPQSVVQAPFLFVLRTVTPSCVSAVATPLHTIYALYGFLAVPTHLPHFCASLTLLM